MEKRYDDLLNTRLEEVIHKGYAFLQLWEAYLWYNQSKLGKNFWRDLRSRFNSMKSKENGELYYYETRDGYLLLDDSGIKPVSDRIGADYLDQDDH